MGTVGINFGAATSGQGFDVASTVTSILANEQQIEAPWKVQLSSLQAQDTAFTSIGTDLATLTTKLQALTDFSGVLSEKQGASSNPNLLALTGASSAAIAGSHTITVNNLAQTSSNFSSTISVSDVLSGSLTLQVGSGATQTISIDSSNNTLASLASAINAAGLGVSASVLTDSTGSRLSLVSRTSGASGQLTIGGSLNDTTTGGAVNFSVGAEGKDASLTVDGVALTSSSNTVSNAIPGVTFQLLDADSNNPVQVQITNDDSDVTSAFQDFVTAYNAVVKDISTQEGKDANGNAEPLFGNPTLSLIQSQLSQALFSGAGSGAISNITQLGLTVSNDGTLSLDSAALQAALDNQFADVTGFLQNSGSFGKNFGSVLNNLGSQSTSGQIYLSLQANAATEKSLNTSIANQETRIANDKTALTSELNSANAVLQGIPSQLDEINQLYAAITGYNEKSQ